MNLGFLKNNKFLLNGRKINENKERLFENWEISKGWEELNVLGLGFFFFRGKDMFWEFFVWSKCLRC